MARRGETSEATDPPRRDLRVVIGGALVALGVGALGVGIVVTGALDDDGPGEPRVGRLVATQLPGAAGTDDEPTADEDDDAGKGTPTTTAASTGPVLGKPQWPSNTAGRPEAFGGQGEPPPADAGGLEDGFYLWQDFNGWHVFVVGGSDADQITIAGDDTVSKAEPTGGSPRIERAGNQVTFARGGATEAVVGMDFNPGYFAKTLVVTVEGDLRLHIGARRYVVNDFYGIQYSAASK